MRRFLIYTKVLVLVGIVFMAGPVFAQDLGSSNTLFGSKKKPAASATKKSSAKKPSSTPAAKKAPAKSTAKPANSSKTTTAAKTKNTKPATAKNAPAAKKTPPATAKNIPATAKNIKSAPQKNPVGLHGDGVVRPSVKKNTIADLGTGSKPTEDPTKYTIPSDTIRTPVRDVDGQPAIINTSRPQPKNDPAIIGEQPTSSEYNEFFERAIDEGNAARDERKYIRAEGAYLRAQSLKMGDARAVYGLGNIYSDQQRWEEAERAYRTAMKMDPSNPASYIALSFVLTQPIPVADLAERYEEAEKIARRAIQLDSGNALAHDQLGVALELRGMIAAETENSYRKAIQLEGSSALAYAHLGRLMSRNGRTKESNEAYGSAVRLASDVPTMILVSDVMQSQQRYTESEQLLRRALSQDPRNPTALMLLGRALTTRSAFDEAEKVLKKSVDVSPHSYVSHTLLGSLYSRQGKFDSAEKVLMQALKVVSANEMKRLAQEFEAVGDGYLRNGKFRDAVRAYRQALALDNEKTGLQTKLSRAQGS